MTEPSAPQATQTLQGLGIVVTRPAHQAAPLCRRLEARGGRVMRFPVIEVRPAAASTGLRALRARLHEFQIAIFVSANAVSHGLALIDGCAAIPPELRIAAVGKRTAEVLREHGCRVDIVPSGRFDSEALLALPTLQRVAGFNVLIFRGQGGREVLAVELRQRGARVEYAEVYQRVTPQSDPTPLVAAWGRGDVDVVIVTSDTGLRNLYEMLGEPGRHHLLATPLVALSERTARLAQQLGFEHPVEIAAEASDEGLVQAVERWHRRCPKA